jgi:hypothetical protein
LLPAWKFLARGHSTLSYQCLRVPPVPELIVSIEEGIAKATDR